MINEIYVKGDEITIKIILEFVRPFIGKGVRIVDLKPQLVEEEIQPPKEEHK